MDIRKLVKKNRSYRRFHEDQPVSGGLLKELVDTARFVPSAANRQPLRYIISNDPRTNAGIFPALSWAGYIQDWSGPRKGRRPPAYIVILADTGLREYSGCDHGIAAQTILLGAAEKGLGGCIIGLIQKERLRDKLNIPDDMKILLVLALGKPAEEVVVEKPGPEGDIRYYRDEEGIHHVPKRSLSDVLIKEYIGC